MISERFRKLENLHIVFWLIKDMCWVIELKALGMAMIAPTLLVSGWMTWKQRAVKSELAHNLAVTAWICANSTWMIGEFYLSDTTRPLAVVFFSLGMIILLIYYCSALIRYVRQKRDSGVADPS